jgi:hypothetical protein
MCRNLLLTELATNYGPFPILAKVGTVAFHLQLPDDSIIHPVFHVSQLKAAHGFRHTVQAQFPQSLKAAVYPLQILDQRVVKKGNRTVSQVLVHWSDSVAADATWEDRVDLQQRFPMALAWGQASSQGEELVKASSVGKQDKGEPVRKETELARGGNSNQ